MQGSLSRGVSVGETKSGWYASYWNGFLFINIIIDFSCIGTSGRKRL